MLSIVIALVTGTAAADTFYIDTSGVDHPYCGSSSFPCETFNFLSAAKLSDGDTVIVRGEHIDEDPVIDKDLTVRGGTTTAGFLGAVTVTRDVRNLTLEDLTFRGQSAISGSSIIDTFHFEPCPYNSLDPLQVMVDNVIFSQTVLVDRPLEGVIEDSDFYASAGATEGLWIRTDNYYRYDPLKLRRVDFSNYYDGTTTLWLDTDSIALQVIASEFGTSWSNEGKVEIHFDGAIEPVFKRSRIRGEVDHTVIVEDTFRFVFSNNIIEDAIVLRGNSHGHIINNTFDNPGSVGVSVTSRFNGPAHVFNNAFVGNTKPVVGGGTDVYMENNLWEWRYFDIRPHLQLGGNRYVSDLGLDPQSYEPGYNAAVLDAGRELYGLPHARRDYDYNSRNRYTPSVGAFEF